ATDALDPFGAGEHQVHDVLGHVVGGGGDEALHAGDVPGTVGVRGRLRATGAHIGAGVGLGEHHGAAPLALDHDLGDALVALDAVGVVVDDAGERGACRIHPDGGVGAEHHLRDGPVDGGGRRGAAEFLADLEAPVFGVH